MDVGQSVGEERRGEEIDSADERRGWGGGQAGGRTDWVDGSEEGTVGAGADVDAGGRSRVLSGGHSLQCVHPLHSLPPSLSGGDMREGGKEMGVSKG